MTHYKATFADGSSIEIANSKRDYAAAWKVLVTKADGNVVGMTGFSRDADLARKSAASEGGRIGSTFDPRRRKYVKDRTLPMTIEVVALEREG